MDKILTSRSGRRARRWIPAAVVWLLVSLSFIGPVRPVWAAQLTEAEVTRIIKNVEVLPEHASARPATIKDLIRGGTAVRTGVDSRSELTFPDQTLTRLGGNTTFSFNEGTRTIELGAGAMLLYAPKGSGGVKISTAAVTAAITGTTVMIEFHPPSEARQSAVDPNGNTPASSFGLVRQKPKPGRLSSDFIKFITLEGVAHISLNIRPDEAILVPAGKMLLVAPDGSSVNLVEVDLAVLVATCPLIADFPPLGSAPLIADEIAKQQAEGGYGETPVDTDPASGDIIDQVFSAFPPIPILPGPVGSTITYLGLAAGNWSSPASWTPAIVPNNTGGKTYTAIINSGNLTQDIAAGVTIQQLQMTGGILVLTNPLILKTGLQFSGGTITAGNLSIAGPSTQSATMGVDGTNITNNGTYDITFASGDAFSGGGSSFVNGGTLRKTSGIDVINFNMPINNSGTVSVLNGALSFTAGGTNSGILSAAAGAALNFASDFSILNGTRFTGPGFVSFSDGTVTTMSGTITNLGAISFISSGSFTDLFLNGNVTLSGGGVVNLTSADRILGTGVFTTNNTIQGETSSAGGGIGQDQIGIVIQAGGVIDANVSGLTLNVDPNTANGLVNQGTMRASNGGILLLDGNGGGGFNNIGTIEAITGGSLQFSGAVTSSGVVDVGSDSLNVTGSFAQTAGTFLLNGGSVTSASVLDFQGGLVDAVGTINSAINNNATLRPALGTGGLIVNGGVGLMGASNLSFLIGGLAQGTQYSFLNVNGTVSLGGNLVVSFVNGFQNSISGSDMFTILSATTVSNTFGNVLFGDRVATSDGSGSFIVTLAGNTIVLSNFLTGPFSVSAIWTGGSGNWSDPTNWNINPNFPNNGQPNGTELYDATLNNGGTITLNIPITIENFTLTSGTVTGANTLTINQLFTWSGGAVSGGDGTVQANGGMTLNGITKTLNSQTVNNAGAASWTAGNFNTGSTGATIGTFTNEATGTFDTDFDGSFLFNQGGTISQFNNAGTFTKSGGVGTTLFTTLFNNTGTVNLNTGTLSLDGGGTSTGAFSAASGTVLNFGAGTHNLNAGSAVSSAGTLQFTGGTWNFNGGTYNVTGTTNVSGGIANFNSAASTNLLTLPSGTLGGTGTLTVGGLFSWSGGAVSGTGTVQANGGMTLNGAARILNSHTVNNAGAASWTAGDFNTGSTGATIGTFTNQAGGTFDTNFDGSFLFNQGGTISQFNNAGTFTKSGGIGTTLFTTLFNNSGTVNLNIGTLSLNGGGTSTGAFSTASNTVLNFGLGTHNLNAGSAVSGAGTIQFTGGTFNFNGSSYNVSETTIVSGGIANFNSAASTNLLTLSSGTLGGTGTLTVSGLFTWSGGAVDGGGGTLQANGGMTLNGADKIINSHTVNNAGAANWTAGNFNTGSTGGSVGTFTNEATGTFDTNFDGSFLFNQGGAFSQFNNAGTFTKSGGVGTTLFTSRFDNTGTVNANSGTLVFNGGYTQTAGTTQLGGGSISSNSTLQIQGGLLTGFGTINAAISNNAMLRPGLAPGGLVVNGNVGLMGASSLVFQIGGLAQGSQYGFLNVTGTATLGGNLVVSFANGFQNSVTNGNTFTIATASGGVTGIFANIASGARLDTSDGFGSFQVDYTGNDLVLSNFLPPGPISATWTDGNGNWSNPANWSINPNFPNNGQPGVGDLYDAILNNGGTINLDIPITIQNFTLGPGTVTGASNLTINQLFTWNSGTLSGSGVTNANGGIAFGNASVGLNQRTLNLAAGQTATMSGANASIFFSNAAVFNNNGTFFARSETPANEFGGTGTFNNIGTFTRDTASGAFRIDSGVAFNNSGTVNVLTGSLDLAGSDGGSTTGDYNIAAGATLLVNSNFNFTATSDLAGAGAIIFGAGTQQINGTYTLPGLTITGSANTTFNIPLNLTTLNIVSGTLGGGTAINVGGLFTWNGGTMSGSGVTNANGGIAITSSLVTLNQRTLNNAAGQTATMAGPSASMFFSNGAIFNNNGTFLAQNDVPGNEILGSGTFNNAGTFTRNTDPGIFRIDSGVAFNNSGTVNVLTGSLDLAGSDGGSTTGDYNIAAGATLLVNSNFNFTATSDLAGAGAIIFSAGTQQINGTYTLPNLTISGSANTTFNIPLNITNLTISNGTLGGGTAINVGGLFTWNGGTMSGSGVTNANGGIAITSSSVTLNQRTLNNAAGQTATMAGPSASMSFSNGAIFNNNGTFLAQNDVPGNEILGSGTFNNTGTFTRDTDPGIFRIDSGVAFNNTGTVNVNSGTLQFAFTTTSSGPINVNGATLSLGGTFTQTAGSINLFTGNLSVGGNASANLITGTSGMINVAALGSLTVANGLDFRGINNLGTPGGTLTLTAPSVTFAPAAINGALFVGGDAAGGSGLAGGDGGNLTVTTTTGDIVVGTGINASTGANDAVPNGGIGGTVNLTANNGQVTVNNAIQVSSRAAGRQSAAGGNINVTSGKATGVAVNISSTGQLLALLDAAAPGPGGKIAILATGASSQVNVGGAVTADHNTAVASSVDIRHTGDLGQITLTNANISADIVKIAALGDNSTLNINGGLISATTLLRLYAGSISASNNSTINFNASVNLTGAQIDIAAHNVNIVGAGTVVTTSSLAQVYATNANYQGSGGTGGGGTGTFGGAGAVTQPLLMAPPIGPPGGTAVGPQPAAFSRHQAHIRDLERTMTTQNSTPNRQLSP